MGGCGPLRGWLRRRGYTKTRKAQGRQSFLGRVICKISSYRLYANKGFVETTPRIPLLRKSCEFIGLEIQLSKVCQLCIECLSTLRLKYFGNV